MFTTIKNCFSIIQEDTLDSTKKAKNMKDSDNDAIDVVGKANEEGEAGVHDEDDEELKKMPDDQDDQENQDERETPQLTLYKGQPNTTSSSDKGKRGEGTSINYQRLNELATPKGRVKRFLNSRRRKAFMVNVSPEHLRLTVPEKSPRTNTQLKNLSSDEVDYMVQPKTIREFQMLTLMRLPPHRQNVPTAAPYKGSNRSGKAKDTTGKPNKKDTRSQKQTASSNKKRHRPKTPSVRRRNPVNTDEDLQNGGENSKNKASFRNAALGVVSMICSDSKLLPKTNSKTAAVVADEVAAPDTPPKRLQTSISRASEIPGDRQLRLRPPRRPAWEDELEARAKDEEYEYDYPEFDTCTMYSTRSSVYSSRLSMYSSRSSMMSRRSGGGGLSWGWGARRKPIDIEQLTKDLDKCTYLRGVDEYHQEQLDITTIFAK